jgi:aldehyde:ferredoxin oxidoreductase
VTPGLRIAYVDLSSGQITTLPVPAALTATLIGGRGAGVSLLHDSLVKGARPLGGDNVAVVSAGVLGGTLASASGRTSVASLSPLDGRLGGANIGGFFAPEMRQAGFDHLVISGKAARPSFLFVYDGKVKLCDASSVWGESVPDTQERLRQELEDDDIQALCIGPAGEKQVRFASLMTRYQGASGRSGMGAVFGAKNLKALVARGGAHGAGGAAGIDIARPAEAVEYDGRLVRRLVESEFGRRLRLGISVLDGYDDVDMGEHAVGPEGCFACQTCCDRRYAIRTGAYAGRYGHGPGYGAWRAWAEVAGADTAAVLAAESLAGSFGLDSLETANLIGWAMRLQAAGVLTPAETDGLDLEPGNAEAVLEMVRRIGRREELGQILGEGGLRAAERLGRGAHAYLRQADGAGDFGVADPWGSEPTPWQALGMATSNRSCDHLDFHPGNDPCHLPGAALRALAGSPVSYGGSLSTDCREHAGKAWLVLWYQMCAMAADMLGICHYHTRVFNPQGIGFEEFSRLLELNAGIKVSPAGIWAAAQRAFAIERRLNVRERPDQAAAPARDAAGLGDMLREYYSLHGWDARGTPPEASPRAGGRTGEGA